MSVQGHCPMGASPGGQRWRARGSGPRGFPETPRVWDDEPFDVVPFYTALEYLKERKPRVLYISLGETDDWTHEGNYPEYLNAAHRTDEYLQVLWETVQSMPEYRGKTTPIFSPDRGRGDGQKWTGSSGRPLRNWCRSQLERPPLQRRTHFQEEKWREPPARAWYSAEAWRKDADERGIALRWTEGIASASWRFRPPQREPHDQHQNSRTITSSETYARHFSHNLQRVRFS